MTVLLILTALEFLLRTCVIVPSFNLKSVSSELGSCKIILDDKLLYKIKPLSRPDINNYGFRGHKVNIAKQSRKRILFLGDSFIMGMSGGEATSIPELLEKKLGAAYEVLNLGILGYGPDQSLRQLEETGLKFRPDMVILGIFPANDFNDIYKNKIFELDKNGELKLRENNLVTDALPRIKCLYLWNWLVFKLKGKDIAGFKKLMNTLFNEPFDTDFMIDEKSGKSVMKINLMRAVLRRFREELSLKNIDFAAVIIPSYENMQNNYLLKTLNIPREKYFINEDTTENVCTAETIPCVNLYKIFLKQKNNGPLYSDKDHHLNFSGRLKTAEIVFNKIQKDIETAQDIAPPPEYAP